MDHVIDRGKKGGYVNLTKQEHDGRSWRSWGSNAGGGGNTAVMFCRSWDRGRLAPDG
ncbi:hypothetical protein A2U01_0058453, partial [Trifolium medium]|nr:hypothetical protein [Trifolium medium]